MLTWSDVAIGVILFVLGGPHIVWGLRAWWQAERELARGATDNEVLS